MRAVLRTILSAAGALALCATTASAQLGRPVSLDSETNVGLNGGAGIDIPLSGIGAFVEARYHTVFRDGENLNMLPVTVGIRF